MPGIDCIENWDCFEWGDCGIDNLQNRTCRDINGCGSSVNKPIEIQTCNYIATCFDGIRNGLETGIDCGGSCKACSHCVDGIQNFDETGIDCGGDECSACATCTDGIRNQGEEGTDCGGPCENSCPEEIQRPGFVCTKDIGPFNIIFWLLIAVVLASDILAYGIYHVKVSYIMNLKKLDEFKKAAKIFQYKRNAFIYIISTLVVVAVIMLYYWFVGVCEDLNIKYLWILAILLVAAYFLINYLINVFEFNEKKKYKLAALTNDVHYQSLQDMIQFHQKKLTELVNEISKIIDYLIRDPEFVVVLADEPEFKQMYLDIVKLFFSKKEITDWNKLDDEGVGEELNKLTEKDLFQRIAKEHPRLKALTKRVELLLEQYEELKKVNEEKTTMEKEATKETEKVAKSSTRDDDIDDAEEEKDTKEEDKT